MIASVFFAWTWTWHCSATVLRSQYLNTFKMRWYAERCLRCVYQWPVSERLLNPFYFLEMGSELSAACDDLTWKAGTDSRATADLSYRGSFSKWPKVPQGALA